MKEQKFYIYSIRDERSRVLYVGVSMDLRVRLSAHRNAKTPVGEVIRKYEAEGRKLYYRIECETTEAYALETERAFIAMYDREKLLNIRKRIALKGSTLPKYGKRVEKWESYLAAKKQERAARQAAKAQQAS